MLSDWSPCNLSLDLQSREHIGRWNSDVGHNYVASKLYLTITPQARVEYEVIKNQRGRALL